MSSAYLAPLLPSELSSLVTYLFSLDTMAAMHHQAIKRCLSWSRDRRLHSVAPSLPSLASPLHRGTPFSPAGSDISALESLPLEMLGPLTRLRSLSDLDSDVEDGKGSYIIDRIRGIQLENLRGPDSRIAQWAADIGRARFNERIRAETQVCQPHGRTFTRMGPRESKKRLALELRPGNATPKLGEWAVVKHGAQARGSRKGWSNPLDPLGIVALNERLKRRGWLVVKIVSAAGVVGVAVVAICRACGWAKVEEWVSGFGEAWKMW